MMRRLYVEALTTQLRLPIGASICNKNRRREPNLSLDPSGKGTSSAPDFYSENLRRLN